MKFFITLLILLFANVAYAQTATWTDQSEGAATGFNIYRVTSTSGIVSPAGPVHVLVPLWNARL